jgi:ABC-type sugar transport system ATPase subunit
MGWQNEDAIVVEGLEKSYGSVHALCGIDFAARAGSVLGLLGPNGAGKTTAVRILAPASPGSTSCATPPRCAPRSASPASTRRSTRT